MRRIGIWALVAATLGPIQNVLGWTISGSLVPGYDPIAKTISDLAADDSPVQIIQSSFFLFGSLLTLVGAWHAKAFSLPGRLALAAAGFAGFGYTFFSTPSQDSSSYWHVLFATFAFVLFSAWPLLAMRFDKRYHWSIRPVGAIPATLSYGDHHFMVPAYVAGTGTTDCWLIRACHSSHAGVVVVSCYLVAVVASKKG